MARVRSTKLLNMRDKSWYSITNRDSGPTLIHIYDEIGYVGVTAQQFMSDIAAIKGPMEVHLNTPGGEVFDGIAIYNALKQRGNVTIVVDSLAASIGSVIAQAGNPTVVAKNAQIMIHDGFGMTVGNAADMREMADLLDKASDNIASIYAEKSGKPAEQWRNAMRKETWFSAEEAVAAGLADHVQGASLKNEFDLSIFTNSKTSSDSESGTPETTKIRNEKYDTDDRKRMASEGTAMPDGSYPIADEEDLDNAIHAVGRGGADHDAIRKHIIKRAKALGLSERIPDNWNSDGSLGSPENSFTNFINALQAL